MRERRAQRRRAAVQAAPARRRLAGAPVVDGCGELLLARFGANLRAARQRLCLSIRIVCERSGLNESYLSEVERGLANISLRRAALVAEVLGTTLPELLVAPRVRSSDGAEPTPAR